jgi:hypothetical protein
MKRGLLQLLSVLALLGATSACRQALVVGVESGSGGTTGTTTDPTGARCPAPSETPSHPYDSEASGTLIGSAVHADICVTTARLLVSPYTTPPGLAAVDLIGGGSLTGAIVESPAGAVYPEFDGSISVSSPSPGVYRSSDGAACGGLVFSFDRPPPLGVDCSGGMPPNCPYGCESLCSGFGCEPCTPAPLHVDYEAHAASDCVGEATTVMGSWTLTLTSAEKIIDDAPAFYLAHGSLTATLVSADSNADTATLSMSF